MSESYYSDYVDALATLKEDGMAITLFTEAETTLDDLGNEIAVSAESFDGYGITTGYSSYYIANDFAKAGDVKLIYAPNSLSDEYLAFYESMRKGDAKVFALIDGVKWRVVAQSEVKPTTSQIIVKAQLRR